MCMNPFNGFFDNYFISSVDFKNQRIYSANSKNQAGSPRNSIKKLIILAHALVN